MKHLKSFLENINNKPYTIITDDEFRSKTCRHIGGEEYDEYGVFKKEELFNNTDRYILNKALEDNKEKFEEYNYRKYKQKKMKHNRSVRPEYADYYIMSI